MKRVISWIMLALLAAAIALYAKTQTDMEWEEILIGLPMAIIMALSDSPGAGQ